MAVIEYFYDSRVIFYSEQSANTLISKGSFWCSVDLDNNPSGTESIFSSIQHVKFSHYVRAE